jgi:hypothetical protein
MKSWAKTTLATLGVLVGGTLLGAVALWALFVRDLCVNQVLTDVAAPNHRTRAVVFERNCGATTDFSTQVSLLRGSRQLSNDGGNVFIADSDHGQAPAGPGGGPAVEVRWIDAAHLEVRHDRRARVFRADSLVHGVRIRFVAINPPGA